MGMNYFRINIPSDEELRVIREKLDLIANAKEDDQIDVSAVISDMQDILSANDPVHICKMSAGWKTNFDHNWGWYYKPNRKSIDAYLRSPGGYLADEYGERISVDDFWKKVNARDAIPGALDSEMYQKKTGIYDSMSIESRIRVKNSLGIECGSTRNDFYSDGLRFSIDSDFR